MFQVLKRVSSSRVRLGLLSVIVGWVLGYLAVAIIANHRRTIPVYSMATPYSMGDGVGGTSYQASPSALPALTLHHHSLAATHLPPSPFPHFLLTPGGPHSMAWTMGRTTQYGMDDGVGDELAGIAIRPHPPGLLTTHPMDYPKPNLLCAVLSCCPSPYHIRRTMQYGMDDGVGDELAGIAIRPRPPGLLTTDPWITQNPKEGAGLPLHYEGAEFYRVIDRFICQTGINTESI
ncbi:unnamed protein product [Closterium sp. NIES-64]|nr:unnamed protein product [Closterium sp. NIES-64]